MNSTESTTPESQMTPEINPGDLRKFYNQKAEMAEFMLSVLRKQIRTPEEQNILDALGNLPLSVFIAPKIASEVIEEIYNNEGSKPLLIVKLLTSDTTMFVRYVKENNPSILFDIKALMPTPIATEKCICGRDPQVIEETSVHRCANPDCMVCKLGFEGTKEQWNNLIAPHKTKKKEDKPAEESIVEQQQKEELPF